MIHRVWRPLRTRGRATVPCPRGTVPELRELRRQYHAALLEFLASPSGPQPVTAAFLWSHSSWDPMNRESSANFDPSIFEAIRRHNARVYALSGGDK